VPHYKKKNLALDTVLNQLHKLTGHFFFQKINFNVDIQSLVFKVTYPVGYCTKFYAYFLFPKHNYELQ